jgi:hypothetical protein
MPTCIFDNCNKQAYYGFKVNEAKYCKSHKNTSGMTAYSVKNKCLLCDRTTLRKGTRCTYCVSDISRPDNIEVKLDKPVPEAVIKVEKSKPKPKPVIVPEAVTKLEKSKPKPVIVPEAVTKLEKSKPKPVIVPEAVTKVEKSEPKPAPEAVTKLEKSEPVPGTVKKIIDNIEGKKQPKQKIEVSVEEVKYENIDTLFTRQTKDIENLITFHIDKLADKIESVKNNSTPATPNVSRTASPTLIASRRIQQPQRPAVRNHKVYLIILFTPHMLIDIQIIGVSSKYQKNINAITQQCSKLNRLTFQIVNSICEKNKFKLLSNDARTARAHWRLSRARNVPNATVTEMIFAC